MQLPIAVTLAEIREDTPIELKNKKEKRRGYSNLKGVNDDGNDSEMLMTTTRIEIVKIETDIEIDPASAAVVALGMAGRPRVVRVGALFMKGKIVKIFRKQALSLRVHADENPLKSVDPNSDGVIC